MEILIIIIAIIAIIAKYSGQGQNSQMNTTGQQTTAQSTTTQSTTPQSNTYRSPSSYSSQYKKTTTSGEEPWQRAARENIEKAARRAQEAANRALNEVFAEGTQKTQSGNNNTKASGGLNSANEISASEQIRKRRLENRHTSILDRAKGNTDEKKEDVTLNTMEAEHNHSERVSAAVHHHPEDVIPDNMLGSVEDLMVKGYDGNLCFERDFVGEAMDMISRFTVPSEVPNYSVK